MEVRQAPNVIRAEHGTIKHATLENKVLVGLCELLQGLRDRSRVARRTVFLGVHERNSGRAGQQIVEIGSCSRSDAHEVFL